MQPLELPVSERFEQILLTLKRATHGMVEPMAARLVAEFGRDPFIVLISCLLSLRARDTMTYGVSKSIFICARTPSELLKIPRTDLEALIRPLGFYRRKAAILHQVCTELITYFQGVVPNRYEDLLRLSGVGPKTANLVLGEGFGIPAICVDVHVHRLSNRLGLVNTKTPEETEKALKQLVPPELWLQINHYLVMWGQNICVPVSPKCSRCALVSLCPRRGVTKSR